MWVTFNQSENVSASQKKPSLFVAQNGVGTFPRIGLRCFEQSSSVGKSLTLAVSTKTQTVWCHLENCPGILSFCDSLRDMLWHFSFHKSVAHPPIIQTLILFPSWNLQTQNAYQRNPRTQDYFIFWTSVRETVWSLIWERHVVGFGKKFDVRVGGEGPNYFKVFQNPQCPPLWRHQTVPMFCWLRQITVLHNPFIHFSPDDLK